MSMTQTEILTALGITTKSAVRAVVDFAKMEMDTNQSINLFRQFAGDTAELPSTRIVHTVVSYLVYDAVKGEPLNVAGCIQRAQALAERLPYNFTDAAEAERQAERAKYKAERIEKAEKAKSEPPAPRETVNDDGTVTRKRGRPPAGVESAFTRAARLYAETADKSKEAVIAMLQSTLGLNFGTAQTYYYKAKKEHREPVAA